MLLLSYCLEGVSQMAFGELSLFREFGGASVGGEMV